MCGGGGSSAPIDTYRGPPGPGTGIGTIPIGYGNYQDAAKALMSTGKTYGQLASLAAQNMQGQAPMAAPPAPQSAFDGGIGQYLAAGGASPAMGQSPATSAIGQLEAEYDPRTSAMEMLESYEPAFEARPLSYYTPGAIEAMEKAKEEAEAERAREAARRASRSSSRGGGGRDMSPNRGSGVGYRGLGDMFDGGGPQSSTIGGRGFQGPNMDGSAGNDGPNGGFFGGMF